MSKRSTMPKVKNSFYPTPYEAVLPLLPHLAGRGDRSVIFDEPCCGAGDLINHLHEAGHSCAYASDIDPKMDNGHYVSALDRTSCRGEMFITNPPFHRGDWSVLNKMITHLSYMAPCWLLLPADFASNKRMYYHLKRCNRIVAIGRVKWFPDSPHSSTDNFSWYLFDKDFDGITRFYGRKP